jgi:hypothetical protein
VKWKTAVLSAWIIGLACLLGFHFGMTALYLAPPNPVKQAWFEPMMKYMDPLFMQNWKLFAPNPVSQHQNICVKAKWKDPETGQIKETPWRDVSWPLIAHIQRDRFSNDGRLYRFQYTAITWFTDKDQNRKVKGEQMLERVAANAIRDFPQRTHVLQVKVRIVTNVFPRFYERYKPDRKGTFYYRETDWMNVRPIDAGTTGGSFR